MNLAEDIFLNIGGIFAFLVAFVPTGGGSGSCQDPDTRVSASVQDNITALLIVGILAIAVAFTLLAIGWKGREKPIVGGHSRRELLRWRYGRAR